MDTNPEGTAQTYICLLYTSFGVIYTMSTIPGAMFDGAGAAASTVISILGGEKDWKGMLAVYRDGLRIVAAAGMIMALFFAAGAKMCIRDRCLHAL